jgi:hypothetical protein
MRPKYPKDWSTRIRPAILVRAGNCCEECGVPNHATGYRDTARIFYQAESAPPGARLIRIVLTVAHLANPDPADCRPENLAALCQQCHNRRDAKDRARNAAQTRRRRSRQLPLLPEGEEA